MKKSLEVPVLIVCKSRDDAVVLKQKLLSELDSQMENMSFEERIKSYGHHDAEFFVQHFAERER